MTKPIQIKGLENGSVYIVYYRPDLFIREVVEVFTERNKAENYVSEQDSDHHYHIEERAVV